MQKILGLAVLMALAAGCTAPTPGGSASPVSPPTVAVPTPSPSQSLDPNQAAAMAALDGYQTAKAKLFTHPDQYSAAEARAMLASYTGYDVLTANLHAAAQLKKAGERWAVGPERIWTKVPDVVDNHNERGLEVHITMCLDSTSFRLLDKSGAVVFTPKTPFAVRQYSVRNPGKAWRVFGETASTGECHR